MFVFEDTHIPLVSSPPRGEQSNRQQDFAVRSGAIRHFEPPTRIECSHCWKSRAWSPSQSLMRPHRRVVYVTEVESE
jgi:hypothetical protein